MSEFGYTGNISSGAGTFDNFKSNNVNSIALFCSSYFRFSITIFGMIYA